MFATVGFLYHRVTVAVTDNGTSMAFQWAYGQHNKWVPTSNGHQHYGHCSNLDFTNLTRAPLGIFITRPTGGGLFRAPPL